MYMYYIMTCNLYAYTYIYIYIHICIIYIYIYSYWKRFSDLGAASAARRLISSPITLL